MWPRGTAESGRSWVGDKKGMPRKVDWGMLGQVALEMPRKWHVHGGTSAPVSTLNCCYGLELKYFPKAMY